MIQSLKDASLSEADHAGSAGQATAEGRDHHPSQGNRQSLTSYASPSATITLALRQRQSTAAKSGQGVASVDSPRPGIDDAAGQVSQRSAAAVPVAVIAERATRAAAQDKHSWIHQQGSLQSAGQYLASAASNQKSLPPSF
jgi:hypothetical protein